MIKNLLDSEDDNSGETEQSPSVSALDPLNLSDPYSPAGSDKKEPFVLSNAEPETLAETTRRSGLAWSAGIVFFSSVVFMLIIGWGADLLFGSSPWGIVGGIILGSLIGFIQFFRLTSQIFKK